MVTTQEELALDALDEKAASAFPGLVVRKDLLRRLRAAYSVPAFVVEFLLGKYCASTDPLVIEQGMEFVRRNLAEKYVKPDEREIVRSRIQQQGEYQPRQRLNDVGDPQHHIEAVAVRAREVLNVSEVAFGSRHL